jgi:hypothetical protein
MQSMCCGPLSDNAGFLEAEVSLSAIHGLTESASSSGVVGCLDT